MLDKGWADVEICSDCLLLVQRLKDGGTVHAFVNLVLADIVHLVCNLNYIVISKVARIEVRATHALAKFVRG